MYLRYLHTCAQVTHERAYADLPTQTFFSHVQIAYKTGDKKKAEQLQRQLMPDDEKEAKGIRVKPAAGARSGPIPQVMK